MLEQLHHPLQRIEGSGVVLIDMNGNEVRVWKGLGCGPNRILPGGYLVTSTSSYEGGPQDSRDMVQMDWDGEIVWKFEKWEEVEEMKAVPNPEKGMPHMVPTGGKDLGCQAAS